MATSLIKAEKQLSFDAAMSVIRQLIDTIDKEAENQNQPFEAVFLQDEEPDETVLFSHPNVVVRIEYRS